MKQVEQIIARYRDVGNAFTAMGVLVMFFSFGGAYLAYQDRTNLWLDDMRPTSRTYHTDGFDTLSMHGLQDELSNEHITLSPSDRLNNIIELRTDIRAKQDSLIAERQKMDSVHKYYAAYIDTLIASLLVTTTSSSITCLDSVQVQLLIKSLQTVRRETNYLLRKDQY